MMITRLRLNRSEAEAKPKRFTLRRVLFALFFVCGLLLCAFFGLRWFEHRVTFHPQRYSGEQNWMLPKNAEEVWFTNNENLRLHGWFIPAATQPATATVIYFHGNGGNISNVGWLGETLSAKGLNVLLFDYRGYGRSEGDISKEEDIYADAEAAYEYVRTVKGEMPRRVVLYGQSLGSTAAIDLASRYECGALIVESGLSSADDMAMALLPVLPRFVHSLARNRFENEKKIATVQCPVLLTHGDPDDRIPTEQGRKLYAAANEPKKLWLIPGANHNVFGYGGKKYLDQIADFAQGAIGASNGNASQSSAKEGILK